MIQYPKKVCFQIIRTDRCLRGHSKLAIYELTVSFGISIKPQARKKPLVHTQYQRMESRLSEADGVQLLSSCPDE